MNKRKSLGQHFLVSESVAESIVKAAQLTKKDIVLEIGTGKGILLPYLCSMAKEVVSIEKDYKLYLEVQKKYSNFSNLKLVHGDGFSLDQQFSVLVSNLPYSESRKAMEWLVQKPFTRAILMVQKEFAQKLLSTQGKNRKAISVLTSYAAKIEPIFEVEKSSFSPFPKVDSVVLRLIQTHQLSRTLIYTINRIFSYRRKTIHNICIKFGMSSNSQKRIEDLSNGEIIKLAEKIIQN